MTKPADLHFLEALIAQNKSHVVRLRCTAGNSRFHNAWQLDAAVCHVVADLLIDAALVHLASHKVRMVWLSLSYFRGRKQQQPGCMLTMHQHQEQEQCSEDSAY